MTSKPTRLSSLISDYASADRGMEIREVAGGYRMSTKPEHHDLIGIVSLFNQITYGVRLCQSDTGEWADVAYQHLFDPFSRTISELPIGG